MRSPRADSSPNLAMTVELTAEECLDAAGHLARQAARHGIEQRVELRRNPSGLAADQHDVVGVSGRKLEWAIALRLVALDEDRTRVAFTLTRYRRGRTRRDELPPAVAFASLLHEALTAAGARPRRGAIGNVVPLRPYLALGAEAG